MWKSGSLTVSLCIVLFTAAWQVRAASPLATDIELLLHRLEQPDMARLYGIPVPSRNLLPALYARRDFAPLWSQPSAAGQLFDAIREAENDGLDPGDYHLTQLQELQEKLRLSPDGTALAAAYDVLLSDALLRLASHLAHGKVDAETLTDRGYPLKHPAPGQPPGIVAQVIYEMSIPRWLDTLRPSAPLYANMKDALQSYRAIARLGGWASQPEGPTLQLGDSGPRVRQLRARLAITADLPASLGNSGDFDEYVEAAVQRFQARHHLEVDGKVGMETRRALNVPVAARIDQIRVNLERMRWILRDVPPTYIMVDIAGFEVNYFKDDQLVWRTRALVGKPYRKTPVFRGNILYLVFNPDWTVPPVVLKNDYLPRLISDPGFLASKNLHVLDHDGGEIDPATVDWTRYRNGGFPYMLRQEPGPDNALGTVKFVFPNKYFVFMHDTPDRSLFYRNKRTFSSGCIRIARPLELAGLLLADQPYWDTEQINKVVQSGETLNVGLKKPVPILLVYWTATVDTDGTMHFRNDPYRRDGALLAALNG
jgi:murein L,D-transpeptidase YcbB/YkuD